MAPRTDAAHTDTDHAGSIVAVVQSSCPHCREFLKASHHAPASQTGRPIAYMDIDTPEGTAYYEAHKSLITGVPTMLAVDAQGQVSLLAKGTTASMEALFPAAHQAMGAASSLAGCKYEPGNQAAGTRNLPAKPSTDCAVQR